jgi:hypothetical protein
MKKLFIVIALVIGTIGVSGCGYVHNPFKVPASITSPAGKTAYTANEIVKQIGEFQTLVIDLSDKGTIPVASARQIVFWTVASIKTIKATPDGWQATIKVGYTTIRPKIADIPAIASWVPIIDGLINFI